MFLHHQMRKVRRSSWYQILYRNISPLLPPSFYIHNTSYSTIPFISQSVASRWVPRRVLSSSFPSLRAELCSCRFVRDVLLGRLHTRRIFSHSMTLNSNTPTQAKADRLPLPECYEMLPQLYRERCSPFDPRPASVKPLKPCGENEERALSLMGNINTNTKTVFQQLPHHGIQLW